MTTQFSKTSAPHSVTEQCDDSVSISGRLYWNRTWNYNHPKTTTFRRQEWLPQARIALYCTFLSARLMVSQQYLTRGGAFHFKNIPRTGRLELRITLHEEDDRVEVRWLRDDKNYPNFRISNGELVWWDLPLPSVSVGRNDLGDLEITDPLFVALCDAYNSVRVGQVWMKAVTQLELPICRINYPIRDIQHDTTHHSGGEIFVLPSDPKDRDVLLHEYGHFVDWFIHRNPITHRAPSLPKYDYNDESIHGHNWWSKEFYERAWSEGFANFLSAMIQTDPHYHDEETKSIDRFNDKIVTIGPHCEGSIATALWRLCKSHGVKFDREFWKAFSQPGVNTALNFYENWRRLDLPHIDKLRECYKTCGMEYGYRYTHTAVCYAIPQPNNNNAFSTVAELYQKYGKVDGGGTLAEYNEEFYNANKRLSYILLFFSTHANPMPLVGLRYVVPERYLVAK